MARKAWMARKKSPTLTDGELRLMNVLWDRTRATVAEVVGGLQEPRPAYNTVLTLLRVMEHKGYVAHRKVGRAFEYYPVIERSRATQRAVRELLRRFFDDSPELLVANLLRQEHLDRDELERVQRLIEDGSDRGEVR